MSLQKLNEELHKRGEVRIKITEYTALLRDKAITDRVRELKSKLDSGYYFDFRLADDVINSLVVGNEEGGNLKDE